MHAKGGRVFEINEILDIAIKIEENGEKTYRDAVITITNPELTAMLIWMADQEAKHANWFKQLKQDIASTAKNPFAEEMSRELINELLGDKSFSLKEVDFSKLRTVNQLISVFIEFENDGILFYEILKPFIEIEETLKNIDLIIMEEQRHIERLQEFLVIEEALLVSSN